MGGNGCVDIVFKHEFKVFKKVGINFVVILICNGRRFHIDPLDQSEIQVCAFATQVQHGFNRITSYNVCYTKLLRGFKDGGVMAQLGKPDMMHAIAYAFSYPDRMDLNLNFPDFASMDGLTFDAPDTKRFPSLEFAYEACRRGGTLPAVMNAANEAAVDAFLGERIGFPDIFTLVSEVMGAHTCIDNPELSGIIEADCWAREKAQFV